MINLFMYSIGVFHETYVYQPGRNKKMFNETCVKIEAQYLRRKFRTCQMLSLKWKGNIT